MNRDPLRVSRATVVFALAEQVRVAQPGERGDFRLGWFEVRRDF